MRSASCRGACSRMGAGRCGPRASRSTKRAASGCVRWATSAEHPPPGLTPRDLQLTPLPRLLARRRVALLRPAVSLPLGDAARRQLLLLHGVARPVRPGAGGVDADRLHRRAADRGGAVAATAPAVP